MTRRQFLYLAVIIGLLMTMIGCEDLRFYSQAARGQLDLVWRRRAIESVIADPVTTARLRQQLLLVQQIRTFARLQLGLPADRDFGYYVELGRPYPVWSVMAAPELSLTPYQWCYPLVGCLGYRGYFSQTGADALAERLRARGLEVAVGGAADYSTLGHLNDPVLSSFVYENDADLAELLFHELAHVRLFAAGDTVFNESFAVTVAEEGLQRFNSVHPVDLAQHADFRQRQSEFVALVMRHRARLQAIFAAPLPDEAKRAQKLQAYAAMRSDYAALKQRWGGYTGYDAWMRAANNARLNGVATYYDDVPALRRLLARNHGDLSAFYKACEALVALSPEARRNALAELAR